MLFDPLAIEGAYRIVPEPVADDRGFFARTFCAELYAERGLVTDFVQRSISFNRRRGTLRGLHYQDKPHAETKIVRCSRARYSTSSSTCARIRQRTGAGRRSN